MNLVDIWPLAWIVFMLGLVLSVIVAAGRERGPKSARQGKSKKGKKGKKGAATEVESNPSAAADEGFGDDGFGNADFPNSDPLNAEVKV